MVIVRSESERPVKTSPLLDCLGDCRICVFEGAISEYLAMVLKSSKYSSSSSNESFLHLFQSSVSV